MPEALKILGQAQPAASTNVALYTVGAGKSAVVSSLVITNTNAATMFSVHACVAGAAAGNGNFIAYSVPIANAETIALTLGITLAAADVLRVVSISGLVTFTAFGTEVS